MATVWRIALRGAEGGSVEMVWRLALETRRRGGSETRRRSVEMVWRLPLETRRGAGRVRGAAGSWGIGGLGGKLSHRAFVKFTWSLPLLIIKQLTQEKGAGEDNLVPPGTAMCLGVA